MHNALMPFVAMALQWQKDKPGEDAVPFQCAEEPLRLIYQQSKVNVISTVGHTRYIADNAEGTHIYQPTQLTSEMHIIRYSISIQLKDFQP